MSGRKTESISLFRTNEVSTFGLKLSSRISSAFARSNRLVVPGAGVLDHDAAGLGYGIGALRPGIEELPEGFRTHGGSDEANVPLIVYNRAGMRLTPASLEQLAQACPNLIGYKDGVGDIELMVSVRQRLGDRFSYLGGLPTAEVFAHAYRALGVPVYSSAVFNFIPRTAMEFYNAYAAGDLATTNRLINDFFLPYLEIRNRGQGYAVSIVKAGAKIVGYDAGPVRAPLTDLLPDEYEALAKLIEADWGDAEHDAMSAMPTARAFVLANWQNDPRGVNGLGVMLRHPAATKAFLGFNNHVAIASSLSKRVRELAILRISWLRRSEYEFVQHVVLARRAGLSDVTAITKSSGSEDPGHAATCRGCG